MSQRKRVRKAVLPVAGLGTRFLPATKAIPKEMLPLVDTPSIQLIVEECVAAGIEEIIFVTARGKSAIEDHFDRAGELESLLERRGKSDDLARVRRPTEMARYVSVRQVEDVYEKTGTGVIALKQVPAGQEHMYGIVDGEPAGPRQMTVRKLIEK